MLSVAQQFENIKETNDNIGNINLFLKKVLIEVATANYKQMLNENLVLGATNSDIKLDAPLRANENVLSGLFNNAFAVVADRYRPEVLISRPSNESDDKNHEEIENETDSKGTGHVDFLAWYDQRCIAIELKKATINCITLEITNTLKNRWEKVVQQTEEAQDWLKTKSNKSIYPYPISIGLMVVAGRCAASRKEDKINNREAFVEALKNLPNSPDFIAIYELPEEYKIQRKINSELDRNDVYIPYFAFIAVAKN